MVKICIWRSLEQLHHCRLFKAVNVQVDYFQIVSSLYSKPALQD